MPRILLTCASLAGVSLAGCGSGLGKVQPAKLNAGGALVFTASEYGFSPSNTAYRRAGKRGPVAIELKNTGSLPHDIRFRLNGRDLGGTATIAAGQTQTVRVALAPKGTYEYFCSVPGHEQQGMRGRLVIQ